MTKEEFFSSIAAPNCNWRDVYQAIMSYDFQDEFENQEINKLFTRVSLFFKNLALTYDNRCLLITRSIRYHFINRVISKIKPIIDIENVYTLKGSNIYIRVTIPSINKTRYYHLMEKGFFEVSEDEFVKVYIGKTIDDKCTYLTLTEMEKSDAILA